MFEDIQIKNEEGLVRMRKAGRITRMALRYAGTLIVPGITTAEIDKKVESFIRDHGAIPSFLHYNGYPKSICTSVNEQVVHGIPGKYVIRDGDIVSIDVGAYIDGYHGDAARTYCAGEVSEEVKQLIRVTKECFYEGLKAAVPGNYVSDISKSVEQHAVKHGYGVVRELTGHGIGRSMHESPSIPNYWEKRFGRGVKLEPGMTLAIEPMINLGTAEVKFLSDGWTVVTRDGLPSAHYENTIAVTTGEPEILTRDAEDVI